MDEYNMKVKTITEHLFEDNVAVDVLLATINKIVNQNKELALDNMKMLTKLQYIKTVLTTENIEDKQKLYFLEGILRDLEVNVNDESEIQQQITEIKQKVRKKNDLDRNSL